MFCFAAALEWTSSSDRRLLLLVNRGRHLWKIKTIVNAISPWGSGGRGAFLNGTEKITHPELHIVEAAKQHLWRRDRHQRLRLVALAGCFIFQPLNSCCLVLLNKLSQIIAELAHAVELTVCRVGGAPCWAAVVWFSLVIVWSQCRPPSQRDQIT